MEQKRLFLAIGLSLLIFAVWNNVFMPEKNLNDEIVPKDETSIEEVKEKEVTPEQTQIISKEIVSDLKTDEVEKTKKISTPLYEIVISNKGAVLTNFRLKKYNETNKKDSDLKELLSPVLKSGSFGLMIDGMKNAINEKTFYSCDNENDSIEISDSKTTITYSSVTKNGIKVEKIFTFYPDLYLIDMDVKITNGSEQNINDEICLFLKNQMNEKSGFSFEGPSVLLENRYEQIKVKKLDNRNTFSGKVSWSAIEDRYFMTGIINKDNLDGKVIVDYNEDNRIVENRLFIKTGEINAGNVKTLKYEIYAGPKKLSVLKDTGYKLEKIVNFGWFDFIAKPCLILMNFIHQNLFSNYGIAIIILTIIFKIIFWPLGTKSYKSMNDMKKLQPLVAELREKYKNDKTKMNQEMMELYKTYKVNPLSGCLPMLVQLPIFFAFYRMLYSAIELRHAPFFGWIQDLSAPDRLGDFGVMSIPFFEPPIGIPVLTILMGASMFLQQKMSPPAGDPAQAKMMMLMPLFMTVIFVNFSSGLVLYWLVNNLVSIGQQYYVMKKNA